MSRELSLSCPKGCVLGALELVILYPDFAESGPADVGQRNIIRCLLKHGFIDFIVQTHVHIPNISQIHCMCMMEEDSYNRQQTLEGALRDLKRWVVFLKIARAF